MLFVIVPSLKQLLDAHVVGQLLLDRRQSSGPQELFTNKQNLRKQWLTRGIIADEADVREIRSLHESRCLLTWGRCQFLVGSTSITLPPACVNVTGMLVSSKLRRTKSLPASRAFSANQFVQDHTAAACLCPPSRAANGSTQKERGASEKRGAFFGPHF